MSRLADAVLLARLIEELLPDSWEEAAQLCSSALDGTFDVEAAKARLRELRPIRDPDAELDRLAGAFPMIERAQVVKLEAGVPYAMVISSESPFDATTHRNLLVWCQTMNAAMGWDIDVLVLQGRDVRISFVHRDDLPEAPDSN